MKRFFLPGLLACTVFFSPGPVLAGSEKFSFGVIAHAFASTSDESALINMIAEADAENLAFVVANGIKSKTEPCSDQVYNRRKALFEDAQHGLVLSLAASDWVDCRRNDGRSAAIERLNRIRDLFFVGEFSFGSTRIPLVRQSLTPKFRSYGENARWAMRDVMFATINLPANNNHFLSAAGRNSEFEDRMVANRIWLQQLFNAATRKNLKAVVIFCDGNPSSKPIASSLFGQSGNRDGFAEIRRQIGALGSKFRGKVLVIHGQARLDTAAPKNIAWRNNVGNLEAGSGWIKLTVDPSLPTLFAITNHSSTQKNPLK
ncbi:MAG: hypothetical protein A3I66_12290 [Burkholderiales bacterium RIFCSPLOWO2_02_FULL_57_36]|nr:MAG: hypothetical protein A3I66_12290 [Burkholderiales bacterium RIFCSPLOWO2_02_FULL_57_36]